MRKDILRYERWEHASEILRRADFLGEILRPKLFGAMKGRYCYQISPTDSEHYTITLGYYIGVDWLVEDHSAIVVAPKLDSRLEEIRATARNPEDIEIDEVSPQLTFEGRKVSIDYFAMLKQCLATDYLYKEIDGLVQIDWHAKEIPIRQSQDWLSPLLIVKYLNILRIIVRKGLKKSYYNVTENLQGKIKGKIMVGSNIKQNTLKNRLTHTICRFEEFGIDHTENRLLKKAFQFACGYLDNHSRLFGSTANHFKDLVSYCRPAFERVSSELSEADMKHYKPNPFFKEYIEGVHLAKLILKRYAYTIANTAKQIVTTPPYWIDMPRLFELYAYHFLKKRFPEKGEVTYHLATYGNELDFLLQSSGTKMVVDAKYKPIYIYGKDHQDMRQLAGYARLNKVSGMLDVDEDELIDCLVIYPDIANGHSVEDFTRVALDGKCIDGYRRMYKIGIKLPIAE